MENSQDTNLSKQEKALKLLNDLIDGKSVRTKDYYSISISDGRLQFQGNLKKEMTKRLTRAIPIPKWEWLDEYDWLVGEVTLDGVPIKFILTTGDLNYYE